MTVQELIEKVEKKRQRYYQGGGPKAIERQHELKKRSPGRGGNTP